MFRHATHTEKEQIHGIFLKEVEHMYCLLTISTNKSVVTDVNPNIVSACIMSSLGR